MRQTLAVKQQKTCLSRFVVFFCIGFLVGIVVGNFLIPQTGGEAGIMSAYFLNKFEYMKIESASLFTFILEKRMKIYIILVIGGVTSFGCLMAYGYTTWLGVSTGAFMSICILRMGMMGILVSLVSLLPQYLIYVPIYIFLIWRIQENQQLFGNCTGKKEKQRVWVKYFIIMLVAGVVLLAGIFLESNVNPFLMKKILKFI
ncbi:MAG: stage II sporulation protein M [Lachnospiraceae bacterium]|nr:stage II sporulation protein M [Lachnospiraceae bacterium]